MFRVVLEFRDASKLEEATRGRAESSIIKSLEFSKYGASKLERFKREASQGAERRGVEEWRVESASKCRSDQRSSASPAVSPDTIPPGR